MAQAAEKLLKKLSDMLNDQPFLGVPAPDPEVLPFYRPGKGYVQHIQVFNVDQVSFPLQDLRGKSEITAVEEGGRQDAPAGG
ncbi:hypothetical protein FQZ97_1004310 [compost metagenome]